MTNNNHKNEDKQTKKNNSSNTEFEANESSDKKNTGSHDINLPDYKENLDNNLQNKEDKNDENQTNESKIEDELELLKEEKLRLLAEMENLRKRSEKDRLDSIRYGSMNLAREILTINDNLSRALESIKTEQNKPESVNQLIDGLNMVQKEFMNILNKHGVKKIDAIEKKFDHNFHQAVVEVETDDHEEGIVVQEIQSGFTMYERLLRPAMVGVSKKLKNKKK